MSSTSSKMLITVPNGTVFSSVRKILVSKFLRLRKVIFCERDPGGDALRMAYTSDWPLIWGFTTPVVKIFALALVRNKSNRVHVFAVSRVGELMTF